MWAIRCDGDGAKMTFKEIAAELKLLAGMLGPDVDTEVLAFTLNRPGVLHAMKEQRRSAELVREAYKIICGLAPAESQVRCLLNDLKSMA